jgi:hypothetical protein
LVERRGRIDLAALVVRWKMRHQHPHGQGREDHREHGPCDPGATPGLHHQRVQAHAGGKPKHQEQGDQKHVDVYDVVVQSENEDGRAAREQEEAVSPTPSHQPRGADRRQAQTGEREFRHQDVADEKGQAVREYRAPVEDEEAVRELVPADDVDDSAEIRGGRFRVRPLRRAQQDESVLAEAGQQDRNDRKHGADALHEATIDRDREEGHRRREADDRGVIAQPCGEKHDRQIEIARLLDRLPSQ